MGQHVRTIRAAFDPIETTWRQAQRLHRCRTLPAARPAAIAMAVTILEVQAGLRPAHQLERLSHYSLWPAWNRLREPSGEQPVSITPRPRAVTIQEVTPGLVDATVVVHFAGRPHALALRLDGAPGFWQLVELDYPTASGLAGPPPHRRPRWLGDPSLPRGPADTPERSAFLEPAGLSLPGRQLPVPKPPDDLGIELE